MTISLSTVIAHAKEQGKLQGKESVIAYKPNDDAGTCDLTLSNGETITVDVPELKPKASKKASGKADASE